jgi:hypothetical protein
MDLLGGYGSDADSDASSSSNDEQTPAPSPAPSPSRTPSISMKSTNVADRATATVAKKHGIDTNTNTTHKKGHISKKGKRLLRLNLNAVLPPEILKRLTQSTVQGMGAGNSDDSDSDNDDNGNNNGEGKETKPSKSNKKQSTSTAADKGLNSLLSDLNGFSPTSKVTKTSSATRTCTATATKIKSGTQQNDDKKETLGMAFMNVSTTVLRKKRNDDSLVVDIHGKSMNNSKEEQVIVEDVDVHSSDSDSDSDHDADTDTKTATPQTMFPEKNKESSKSNAYPSTATATATATAAAAATATTSRSRIHSSVRVPRPAAPGIQRAPNVAPSLSSSSLYNTIGTSASASMTSASAASMAQSQFQHPIPQQQQQQQQPPQQPNKKRSKKELEKALRAGNLESLDIHQYTQNAHTMDSINYAPHQNHDQLAPGSDTGAGTGGSYHAGGLEHYVPSEGATVKGFSGKMKGKHQIHSLVQNAANLEANQRRMDAMGMGMGGAGRKGKSSRADAKRKYGW